MDTIISQVLPVLITSICGVLVVIIKSVGDSVISYIKAKKQLVLGQIGIDEYNKQLKFAGSIWKVVEEYFRVSEVVGDIVAQKQELFDKLLKERIPTLTDSQILLLRQTIAGTVNDGKTIVVAPVMAVIEKVQESIISE